MWSGPRIGKLFVVITPLLDESTSNGAHGAQEEADKQHDIDANGGTPGAIRDGGILIIAGEENLVYFDDKRCDNGREQSVLQGGRKRLRSRLLIGDARHHSPK